MRDPCWEGWPTIHIHTHTIASPPPQPPGAPQYSANGPHQWPRPSPSQAQLNSELKSPSVRELLRLHNDTSGKSNLSNSKSIPSQDLQLHHQEQTTSTRFGVTTWTTCTTSLSLSNPNPRPDRGRPVDCGGVGRPINNPKIALC